jgi:crotonobetainyl-CoA:carnitine CoA-transferase CaiB-like acyl-CoA transferase
VSAFYPPIGADPKPLTGVVVLDLSRVLAGPWAGQILGDLGADVIKVERPGVGDDTRTWGPPFLVGPESELESAYFLGVNRAKRSITVNLKVQAGQQIIRDLAAQADILLENYKVGTLKRFDLDYESLREVNPDLIYCSITGFGQSGPRAQDAAYDFAVQALGGLMSVTGERDDAPGGGPQKVGVPIVDLATGLYAAVAILAALQRRQTTGHGDRISIAMLDVQVALLANQAMNYLMTGKAPERFGNRHPNVQPQNVYRCRDRELAIAVGSDRQFGSLCQALDMPELADDERFVRNQDRVRNVGTLEAVITERLSKADRDHWMQRLTERGIPCAPINSIADIFADAQVRHRGMHVSLPHPSGASVPQVGSPFLFDSADLTPTVRPPLLGEHTDEILGLLGRTEEEITKLREIGAI